MTIKGWVVLVGLGLAAGCGESPRRVEVRKADSTTGSRVEPTADRSDAMIRDPKRIATH